MTPWLVRIILAVLALEAGVCVAFLADDWDPLRKKEEIFFETVLSKTRSGQDFVLDESQPISRVRLVRPLKEGAVQPYFHIPVDEKSTEVLESYPPSPTDWHALLKHMHEVGCKIAAIEQPMSWEGDDLYHWGRLASLDRSLALYETAVLTVDLQRLPKHEAIPEYLRRTAIPLSNVKGELGSLVRVNRVLHAPSATAAQNIRFSFRVQESAEGAAPEFVRWDDYLIPSFPLAVAMAHYKIPPDRVKIELGRHIRLGQLQMKLVERPQRAEISAEIAVLKSEIPQTRNSGGSPIPRCALFTNAGADNPSPWDNHNHLQKIISSFDVLPRPDGIELHHRLTIAGEIALLGLIAIMAAFLASIPKLLRNFSFLILTLLLPALLVALFVDSHKWTPFAPVLATILVGWILATRMARHLPSPKMARSAC
jgi:hypothetical protein